MPQGFPLVQVVSIVLLAVGFAAAVHLYERKRSETLRSTAYSLGLSFKKDIKIDARFGSFHLFSQGSWKMITNCMSGELDGAEVMVFGYRFRADRGGGGGRLHGRGRSYKQTVVSFRSDKLTLPPFELRPEKLFHKIGGVFGYQDIDFSSHPNFSDSYLVRGNDEVAIRHVFSTNVLTYFEQSKGLSVEGKGDTLVCYRDGKLTSPKNIKSFLDEGRAVFALFIR